MLRALLAKDFARARRNPLPWLIFLLIPLLVVGAMGFIFRGETLATIHLAVVDEDNTIVTRMLRGSLANDDFKRRLGKVEIAPVLLERDAALARLNANKLSAVIVLPAGLTSDFLAGRKVTFELIKNPAESLAPTLVEETLGVLTAALDGLARNFADELPGWRAAIEGDEKLESIGPLLTRAGKKLRALGSLLDPPLVGYTKPAASATGSAAGDTAAGAMNLFGYLLIGMAAMFLLFLGGVGMGDLHREIELRTLARYQTLHLSLVPFIGAKVVFAGLMLLLCAAIQFVGGAAVFGVSWHQPLPLLALVLGYAIFVTGLMAALVAWIPDQRKADAARSLVSMLLAMAGGCAFPPDNLPPLWREHVLPLLPTNWFAATARALEYGDPTTPWVPTVLKLTLAGALLLLLAAWLFRRHFAKGGRA
jgi:ABC-2 type transport system permease protein